MNEYGSNGRSSNVIGNGSHINRQTRPEQRRPARQFVTEEEYVPRERHVSQTMRTQSSNTQINQRPTRNTKGAYSRTNAERTSLPSRNRESVNINSLTNERDYLPPRRRETANINRANNERDYLPPRRRETANTNRTNNERDYLPPRRREDENIDKRKRYSNISRANVNAGYGSVPGRVRQKEKDFDDFNFDMNQNIDFESTNRRSKNKQIDFNANDFDDFDADNLFESFDIDEYGDFSRQKYADSREHDRKSRKNNRKPDDTKNKKSDLVFLIVACFEAALTIFFIALLLIVDILPTLYLVIAIVVLVLIAAGLIITQIKKINRNKKLRIAGRVICIFLCVILIIGSYFVALTRKAIDSVSKETAYAINQVHVAVLASDNATSLKDVKGETFGTISTFKPLILNEAMKDFEKQAGGKLKTKDYTNSIDLIKSLYSKETRVVIFNNDLKGDIVEKYENFESEVKIIYTFKSKTEINIKSNTNVDVTTQPFLFYISGNDGFGEISVGGRSDVNMLVAVNPISREVLLISIPRDYYVTFAGVSGTARDKLTHAGIYGVDTQCDTLAELYGYNIDFYCVVNFSSFEDIVEAVGGIDIENEMDFTSIGGVFYQKGPLHLSGSYALEYVREREAFEDGDFARGRHQQQAIEAIIHKLLSSTGLTAYSQIVNTLERVCVTNMPKESISALIKKQLAEGGSWNISKVQAEGVPMIQPSYASGGIGLSVVMPYTGSIDNIKAAMGQLYAGEVVEARQMNDNDDWSYVITPLPVPEDEEETSEEETSDEETSEEETSEDETSEDETSEDDPVTDEIIV